MGKNDSGRKLQQKSDLAKYSPLPMSTPMASQKEQNARQ